MSDTRSADIRRVLVIAPTPFFGDRGCHVRIFEEVRHLQARGIECLVTTYSTGRDLPEVHTKRSASIPGVRAGALGPSHGRVILDGALTVTALRAARRFKPDIIHAHLHEGIAIGSIVRRAVGAPLVADLQGSLTSELVDHRFLTEGGWAERTVGSVERWLVKRPDLLVTSSGSGVGVAVGQGVSSERVMSLPDGVDLTLFPPAAPDQELRHRLGLDGKPVVVFLGVLTKYQGVDALIDAVPEVLREVPDAHFLVMGYPNEDAYRALVAARGLERSVTLPGRIPYEEAPRWLSLGNVAVSAKESLTEANGKLLNYMACALPVVATDTVVNRELLGESGVYVKVGDRTALARAIVDLLRDPDRARAIGQLLRQRAESQFSWPALTERLVEAYRKLLAGSSPRPERQ